MPFSSDKTAIAAVNPFRSSQAHRRFLYFLFVFFWGL